MSARPFVIQVDTLLTWVCSRDRMGWARVVVAVVAAIEDERQESGLRRRMRQRRLGKAQKAHGEDKDEGDVTGLVAYLGVRGAGRVHNERNSHCRDAMQHHICPFSHHHQ